MAGPSILVRILGDVTGLGQSMTSTATAGQTAAGRIHTAFSSALATLNQTGVLGPFGGAIQQADQALQGMAGHAKTVGTTLMGVGGVAAGVGVALQAAASKDQAAHQQLQAAITATGKSYTTYAGKIEDAIKQQENFGTTAGDTQNALQALTQATHTPTDALKLLGTAANLAAAKHEGLTTAATQLGKVYNGNTRVLKTFGIELTKNATGAKTTTLAMTQLSKVLAGQATASASTFSGHLADIKAHLEDTVATLGAEYGPAITAAGVAMTALGSTIDIVKASVDFFKDSTILSTIATTAQTAATYVVTAAQWLLNLALSANPIVIVVILIAGLIAAVILAYQHITIFRQIVSDMGAVVGQVFSDIWNAAQVAFNWIKDNWPLLLAILSGPFGLAVLAIVHFWTTISAFLTGLPGKISSAVVGMWDGIAHAFRAALNDVIDLWNSLKFTLPTVDVGPVHLGGETIGVPQVPHLAQGGLMTGDGLVYAHAGEVITPAPLAGRTGPLVNVENANFATELDIDSFMKRAAWAARTAVL